MAFDSVPTWTSTRPCMPKWSMVPRPFFPNTPLACASSTIMMQPVSSASAQSAGSGPRSPSMLKTPSVISSLRWPAGSAVDDPARGVDVLVRKDLDRGAAQPAAVDDAGVIQLVGDDHVVFGEDGGDGAGVGGEAALKDDHRFDLLELGELPFELHVDGHRAGDGANRSGPDAERLRPPRAPAAAAAGASSDRDSCSTRD